MPRWRKSRCLRGPVLRVGFEVLRGNRCAGRRGSRLLVPLGPCVSVVGVGGNGKGRLELGIWPSVRWGMKRGEGGVNTGEVNTTLECKIEKLFLTIAAGTSGQISILPH